MLELKPGELVVGMNYPSYHFGIDFGPTPDVDLCKEGRNRGTRGTPLPRAEWSMKGKLDQDIRTFQALGIQVVKWLLLADGWNYGVGPDRPVQDLKDKTVQDPRYKPWHFNPPELSPLFVADFRSMLEFFRVLNKNLEPGTKPVYLLPSLISHDFCYLGKHVDCTTDGWIKAGRADVVLLETKSRTFFEKVLQPLLKASDEYKDVIFAWELFNEPENVIFGADGPKPTENRIVSEERMKAFLKEGLRHIESAGFKTTIGLQYFKTLQSWTDLRVDYPQFHYYPEYNAGYDQQGKRKPPANGSGELLQSSPSPNCCVGEIASAIVKADDGKPYDWPGTVTQNRAASLFDRLCWVKSKNYGLVMLWEVHDERSPQDKAVDTVNVVDWSPRAQAQVRAFARHERTCPS